MHQRTQRSHGRLSNIVRAASVEVTCPESALEQKAMEVRREAAAAAAAVALADAQNAKALRELLAALGRQVEETRSRRKQMCADVAGLSVELGIALAERLLAAEIAADRQRLDRIVQQALARLPGARAVTVRAHPDDIALLEKQLAAHDDLKAHREMLTLRADAAIARGQLKLEAGELFVEWDTASCLAELHTALLEATL